MDSNAIYMKRMTILATVVLVSGSMAAACSAFMPDTGDRLRISADIAIGGQFILNKGQVRDRDVIFLSGDMYFTSSGVIFRLAGEPDDGSWSEWYIFKMNFIGSNGVSPEGSGKLPQRYNYFMGNDPSAWIRDAPAYEEIIYRQLYDDIDLVYRAVDGGMKYEFRVYPGGDCDEIRLGFDGAGVSTDGSSILMKTPLGSVRDAGFVVYELAGAERTEVDARIIMQDDTIGFRADYDRNHTLIIDPFIFSSYLGGNSYQRCKDICTDAKKNVYLTGETLSANFPTTPGSYQPGKKAYYDAFVSTFDSDGDTLLFSTFVGGNNDDLPSAIELDSSGDVVVAGFTYSSDFPTTAGAYDSIYDRIETFVLKLSSDGSSLLFSTFLCGHDDTIILPPSIEIDPSDDIYITGQTTYSNFPVTPGAYQTTMSGGGDIFVAKLNSSGKALEFSTFIGGSRYEYADSIAVDDTGNVTITGRTTSRDFPTTAGAYDSQYNGDDFDAIVARLNSSGDRLLMSTYLGGSSWDEGNDVVVDGSGNTFVTGTTQSPDFPNTTSAFDKKIGGNVDAFVSSLNLTGGLLFSTFIGGTGGDWAISVGLDDSGNIHLVAGTGSTDFPLTPSADCSTARSFALLSLRPDGSRLEYSTYMADGEPRSMVLDGAGDIYIAGSTQHNTFPTTSGAYDTSMNGPEDGFFLKFRLPAPPSAPRNLGALPGDGYQLLNWSPPDFDGYRMVMAYVVYRGTGGNEPTEIVRTGNFTIFNDTGLANGQTYRYQVSAINIVGEGNRSAIFNFTTGTYPTWPRDLRVASGDRYCNLSWTPPTDIKGFAILNYTIYRGVGDGKNLTIHAIVGNTTTYNDTGVTNGLRHYYAVGARNARGESIRSSMVFSVPGAVPSAPTNLEAMAGDGYVLLGWSLPAYDGGLPVERYRVYEEQEGSPVPIAETYEPWHNASDIRNGEPIIFSVSAVNAIGEGERSVEVTAVGGLLPEAPVVVQNTGNAQVALTWSLGYDGGLAVRCYNIRRSGGPIPGFGLLANTTKSAYTDLSVVIGVTYQYTVSAVNLKGEGPGSAPLTAKPDGEGRLPDPPADLSGQGGNGWVHLEWKPPADTGGFGTVSYVIYRGSAQLDLLEYSRTGEGAFNDTRVMNNLTYYYAVSCINEIGEGHKSAVLDIRPAGPGGLPGTPLNLSAKEIDGNIGLSWEEPESFGGFMIAGYNIYRGTDKDSLSLRANTTGPGYLDSDYRPGTTYYYGVTAVNPIGEGARTAPAAIAVFKRPGRVENLTISAGKGYLLLTWQPPTETGGFGILEYRVYRGIAGGDHSFIKATASLEHNDTKLANGQNYCYTVSAVNSIGEGANSTPVAAMPGSSPGKPRDLEARSSGPNVVLRWKAPDDTGGFAILEFRIYRGTSRTTMDYLATTREKTYTDSKTTPGTTYYYKVAAVNERGEGTPSETASAKAEGEIDQGKNTVFIGAIVAAVAIVASISVGVLRMKRKR